MEFFPIEKQEEEEKFPSACDCDWDCFLNGDEDEEIDEADEGGCGDGDDDSTSSFPIFEEFVPYGTDVSPTTTLFSVKNNINLSLTSG